MIGRIEETKMLQSLLYEEDPQFIAVFGRRRIGKTYLVRESFHYQFTFQHTGISNLSILNESRKQAQLDKFEESLADAGYKCPEHLRSWNEAFNGLKEVINRSKDKKKVISRKEKDIILIVCASATYWMMENIVNAKGGLHNRLTGQIHLKPFTLRECEEYMLSRNVLFSRHQILQCYMILGGVPYYWSLLKKGKSLPQNIDDLFFKENALLQNEYDNLYRALFNKPDQYIRIIEALSRVKKGITRNEISRITKIASSGELSKKLTELENCGFIRIYAPYGYKQRNLIYQLIDNYTLFYHQFLKKRSFDENEWQNLSNTPAVTSWSGMAFERVCLEHVPQIKAALGISGVHTEVNTWQCPPNPNEGIYGSQIDLLIVRKDQVINLCEMKYSETGYIVKAAFNLDQKRKCCNFVANPKISTNGWLDHSCLIYALRLSVAAKSGSVFDVPSAVPLPKPFASGSAAGFSSLV